MSARARGLTTETRVRYGQVSIKLTHRSPSKSFKERERKERRRGRRSGGRGRWSLCATTREAGRPTSTTTAATTTTSRDEGALALVPCHSRQTRPNIRYFLILTRSQISQLVLLRLSRPRSRPHWRMFVFLELSLSAVASGGEHLREQRASALAIAACVVSCSAGSRLR